MADEQEHGARRRLLQDFQKGVAGIAVHLLGPVHDHHAPAAFGWSETEEAHGIAHVIDHDFAAHPAGLGIWAAGDKTQVGMAAARHQAEDGMARVEGQAGWPFAKKSVGFGAGTGKEEAREAEGKRGLADAPWAGQQPGMVKPA